LAGLALLVVEYRSLADAVNPERDFMADAAGCHIDPPLVPVEHEGHCDQRFEGVSLRASVRFYVRFAAGHAAGEVQDGGDRVAGDSRTVVRDNNALWIDSDLNLRRRTGLFAGI
jgi:hypothetical protein